MDNNISEIDYDKMGQAIKLAMNAFPRCRIASCGCDEFNKEWKKDCMCLGHLKDMDDKFGKGWKFKDFSEEAGKEHNEK